mmetsp:Transcript_101218/g.179779  ORF Transcript_101218/g.179779 Transcript_101218/m.179779 type:complete len:604 (-) Transcript_101218:139-1950(-)
MRRLRALFALCLCLSTFVLADETLFAFSANFSVDAVVDGSANFVGSPWINTGTSDEDPLEITSGVLDTSQQESATSLAVDFVCTFGDGDTLVMSFDTVVPSSGSHGVRSSWAGILLYGTSFGAAIPRVFIGNAPETSCLTVTAAGDAGCDVSSECCPSYGGVENTSANNDATVVFSYNISTGEYQLQVSESGQMMTSSGTIPSAAGYSLNRLQIITDTDDTGSVADIAIASLIVTGCGVTTTTTTQPLRYAFLSDFKGDGPVQDSQNLVGSNWINTKSDAQLLALVGGVLDTSQQQSATSLAADFVCSFNAGDTLKLSFNTVVPSSGSYGDSQSWAGILLDGTSFGAEIPRIFIGKAPKTSCLTVTGAGSTGCNVNSECCTSYGGVENTTAGNQAFVELSYDVSSGSYEVNVNESGCFFSTSGFIASAAGYSIDGLQIVAEAERSGSVADIALEHLQVTGCGEVLTTGTTTASATSTFTISLSTGTGTTDTITNTSTTNTSTRITATSTITNTSISSITSTSTYAPFMDTIDITSTTSTITAKVNRGWTWTSTTFTSTVTTLTSTTQTTSTEDEAADRALQLGLSKGLALLLCVRAWVTFGRG